MKPAISVILDTRRAINTGPHKGLFPVKLKATFKVTVKGKPKWVAKYFHLLYCAKRDYQKVVTSNPRTTRLKQIREAIINAEVKANAIVDKFQLLNIDKFSRLYMQSESNFEVKAVFEDYIEQLVKEERLGNAEAYRNARASILKFGSDQLQFVEISASWLKKYELHMLKQGRSRTTVGMYLRCLRKIFNIAIEEQLVTADLYPFSKGGFRIASTQARKIALNEKQKNQILAFASTDEVTNRAIHFWQFSYFCNGMNFADIARLRRSQVSAEMLTLYRSKSANTSRHIVPIIIPMRPEVQTVINRYGSHSLNPKDYVFEILHERMTPAQQKAAIHQWLKVTNKALVKVGEKLKFPFRFTTYTARHTFATVALRHGATKEFIQEALGHASMHTTESYLGGLDFDTKKAVSDKL